MTDQRLTGTLAVRVLGWRTAPGRFIKTGRSWIPSWRFAPLTSLEDAFALLDAAAVSAKLRSTPDGLDATVRVGRRVGKASGRLKARVITLALARALGMEVPAAIVASDSERSHPQGTSRRSHGI